MTHRQQTQQRRKKQEKLQQKNEEKRIPAKSQNKKTKKEKCSIIYHIDWSVNHIRLELWTKHTRDNNSKYVSV